ncbi:unnamed protein product [Cylindrotheca closterium]|uniref:PPIase cyclophilin-type domain-containing protein n=1 Tax=Cylindrotheca closterium TaxID=2856 RepID=A0AAD2CRE0_9STRA|nr:unnamed protein product [Cylindrotheca closterium]
MRCKDFMIRRSRPEVKRSDPDGPSYPSPNGKRDKREKRPATGAFLAFALTLGVIYLTIFKSRSSVRKQISPAAEVISGSSGAGTPNATEIDKDSAIVECIVSTANWKSDEAANGVLRITVDRRAPDSELFLYLVSEGYYDETHIFRVIKGFVAQFGFHPDKEMINWKAKIENKRKVHRSFKAGKINLQNEKGTLTMIKGPSPQIFLNIGDNRRLDKDGTLPVGFVDDYSIYLGEKIYSGYKPGIGQIASIKNGTVSELFPRMSKIEKCSFRE